MLKKTLVLGFVSLITLLIVACGNSTKDACEHVNEVCASKQGFTKSDCSQAEAKYDALSDADKEKADKIADCVNDADTCDAVLACVGVK